MALRPLYVGRAAIDKGEIFGPSSAAAPHATAIVFVGAGCVRALIRQNWWIGVFDRFVDLHRFNSMLEMGTFIFMIHNHLSDYAQ